MLHIVLISLPTNFYDMIEKRLPNQEYFIEILKRMSVGIYGKEYIILKALLCALAGESMFLLGPPGTAKSLIARRLKTIFKGAKAFEYLMSRYSTPDDIFGPVSIAKLKNEDKYERLVTDYLPDASIVFLDEIWKAGPAIQNSLLTAINERIYKNGSSLINLPMKVLIAASNELPEEGQGLEALWDRFLIKMVSNSIDDEALFFDMVRADIPSEITLPDNLLISDDEYSSWQEEIRKVVIPDDICKIVSCIRQRLVLESKKDEHQEADFYVSDRRWKKIFHQIVCL
jgi:MoxR-like ATPase